MATPGGVDGAERNGDETSKSRSIPPSSLRSELLNEVVCVQDR